MSAFLLPKIFPKNKNNVLKIENNLTKIKKKITVRLNLSKLWCKFATKFKPDKFTWF